ncbi:LAGLIDADG family homing endonuclease [Candidatus Kaiserbacteria bacterium]|nr:LAGLIDADG family homing endonuclease [Candidatus Kaiserbacteria bacterium]
MRKIYNFKPKRYKNLATGVQRICYFNVPFSAHVKERADDLLRRVTTMPRALKREFLKAFFDDEGCIDFRPYKNIRRVRGYQKDVSILSIVKVLLEDMGIASNIKQPNEIVISGKSHLIRFQKEIDFSPGVRVNGKRSNSIWKRHLEKRVILSRAIRSYK